MINDQLLLAAWKLYKNKLAKLSCAIFMRGKSLFLFKAALNLFKRRLLSSEYAFFGAPSKNQCSCFAKSVYVRARI